MQHPSLYLLQSSIAWLWISEYSLILYLSYYKQKQIRVEYIIIFGFGCLLSPRVQNISLHSIPDYHISDFL
jgi:hypothetical protein